MRLLEDLARHNLAGLRTIGYRGMAPSRLDRSNVGAAEFLDETHGVVWPEGWADHYVGKYNVRPSLEFIQYVLDRTRNLPHGRIIRVHKRTSKSPSH